MINVNVITVLGVNGAMRGNLQILPFRQTKVFLECRTKSKAD